MDPSLRSCCYYIITILHYYKGGESGDSSLSFYPVRGSQNSLRTTSTDEMTIPRPMSESRSERRESTILRMSESGFLLSPVGPHGS